MSSGLILICSVSSVDAAPFRLGGEFDMRTNFLHPNSFVLEECEKLLIIILFNLDFII